MGKTPDQSFDRQRKPPRQNGLFLPFLWLGCWLLTRPHRLKIYRQGLQGCRPPWLVLATHHGFVDFYVTPLALFPHRANYISELEGFVGKEWLYRQVGCLCKRKFTTDLSLIRNIRHVVQHNRDSIVIYPEARYCNVGTQSRLPESVGKLAKLLGVPVVVLRMQGNYLRAPIWNLHTRWRVPLQAELRLLFTPEQLETATVQEINQAIAAAFVYDDYRYQQQNRIAIAASDRAQGLHLALYRCPACGGEYTIGSAGAQLFCRRCGKRWELDPYGWLHALSGATEFAHIPDWYEAQRAQVQAELAAGSYRSEAPVRVQALPNARGFIELGEGWVCHDARGFRLTFTEGGQPRELTFAPLTMTSVHTEYNYRGQGPCITLSTLENTYFLYPLTEGFSVTKVQFATEELYLRAKAAVPAAAR